MPTEKDKMFIFHDLQKRTIIEEPYKLWYEKTERSACNNLLMLQNCNHGKILVYLIIRDCQANKFRRKRELTT